MLVPFQNSHVTFPEYLNPIKPNLTQSKFLRWKVFRLEFVNNNVPSYNNYNYMQEDMSNRNKQNWFEHSNALIVIKRYI